MTPGSTWHGALERVRLAGDAAVLVTVVRLEGSAPRGVGSRMLVSRRDFADTIGGGALERAALEHARAMLSGCASGAAVEHRTWSLGKALSQCCGGRVTLAFERFPAADRIEVFGAGHVARELARLLRRLPCIATFHDPRPGWLARLGADASEGIRGCTVPDIDLDVPPAGGEGPGIVRASALAENVHGAVERCRPGGFYLVMTHSHELDFEVCEAVLSRGDASYLGLIASTGKARAFRTRLRRKGFTPDELAGLVAPLGRATGVRTGNLPIEVAVAALADVLTARERVREAATSSRVTATTPAPIATSAGAAAQDVPPEPATGSSARVEASGGHGLGIAGARPANAANEPLERGAGAAGGGTDGGADDGGAGESTGAR